MDVVQLNAIVIHKGHFTDTGRCQIVSNRIAQSTQPDNQHMGVLQQLLLRVSKTGQVQVSAELYLLFFAKHEAFLRNAPAK
jgi:hypothetical protein